MEHTSDQTNAAPKESTSTTASIIEPKFKKCDSAIISDADTHAGDEASDYYNESAHEEQISLQLNQSNYNDTTAPFFGANLTKGTTKRKTSFGLENQTSKQTLLSDQNPSTQSQHTHTHTPYTDNTLIRSNLSSPLLKIIKKECIKHYQNIIKSEDQTEFVDISDLSNEWQDTYDPTIQQIKDSWWSDLNLDITVEDIINIFPKLSKRKAPGPSKITYEDLIHLDKYALNVLKNFYNKCLQLGWILDKWKEALLFPT
ncbi:hypothetical protein C1646_753485 [Rhizophagus diaphanus]|nr:hypothetical protein C1646_753485 [Rhizophagus diaphanus] [Rhizophagus sp. MUCL 43196]